MALPQLSIQTTLIGQDIFSDSRAHGFAGPNRNVRLPRACSQGGGAISHNEDGSQCAVAGRESLRILRVRAPKEQVLHSVGQTSAVGHGGFRAEASRNFWDGSGLKIDSASTDVAWAHGQYNRKILTSARNGELIMWDVDKEKYERRTKDHTRSIHKLSVSNIVQHYCITGSSDGDLRIWDIRDLSRSISRIHYPTTIRSLVFSPTSSQPLQVMVGLDNGSIYRWDLKMAQRGQLDRVPVAHTAPVTALDWRAPRSNSTSGEPSVGLGWIVSGGLDRTVKVWDLTWPSVSSHIPHKPSYTLHPSFPVRQVRWRPGYECELAIVSNAEFTSGSNPDLNANGLQRSGSGLGLATGDVPPAVDAHSRKSPSASSSGDPLEIWDVRRGWIAKWSVLGSAVEGGVTGMTFGDSHAIWAQHSSGMFSQIDLRDCSKPLDSIPRVSASWEASGSVLFVSDKKQLWEAPYDDIPPEQRERLAEPKRSLLKALGDRSYSPKSQATGTFNTFDNMRNMDSFSKLAKGYVFHGQDRKDICAVNAQLAFQAEKIHAGQVWLLVGASLSDVIPPETDPEVDLRPPLSHGTSTQTQVATNYTFPPSNTASSLSSELGNNAQRSTSGSRVMTPTSSLHTSPHHGPLALTPSTPLPPSLASRRESLDSPTSATSSSRRPSVLYRRGSMSLNNASPGDRSLRHVGEGALDDSDSSGSANDNGGGSGSGEEELAPLRSLVSPTLSATRTSSSHPSPLSRVMSRTDSSGRLSRGDDLEDDEDEGSPSPRSTDSEGSDDYPRPAPVSPRLADKSRSRSKRRASFQKSKSRSRASTGGSATLGVRSVITRKASHSSIKTVTGETPSTPASGVKAEDTIRDWHTRDQSVAVSELVLDDEPEKQTEKVATIRPEAEEEPEPVDISGRRPDLIVQEERVFRTLAWNALKDALEDFADDGDVQMCAMLCLVAGKELNVEKRRVRAFLDMYIDILTRMRLHTCSAHLRKYCETKEIRDMTLLETTIYTACGRCRKALLVPLGASERNPNGGYWLCSNCKGQPISCSICRMPVRGLIFQCSICSHGGHHMCYQHYYVQRPMTDLPRKVLPVAFDRDRGRSVTRGAVSLNDEDASFPGGHEDFLKVDNLMGRPCAAGCGHFCWAAVDRRDD